MKVFNTVLSIVLLIAVCVLFWKVFDTAEPTLPKKQTEEQISENLDNQKFTGVKIAYINTDSLVSQYDFHKELRDKLEKKAIRLEADLEKKSKVFQENVQILQQQAEKMSPDQLQAAQLDLQQTQQQLMAYRDEQTQKLAAEEQELNLLIKDDMDGILENIKTEFDLDYILSYDPGSILLAANADFDITEMVAQRLNEKFRTKGDKGNLKSE